jgi:hypothetical protein
VPLHARQPQQPRCASPADARTAPDPTRCPALPCPALPCPALPPQSLHIWHIWDRAAEAILKKQQELSEKGWPDNTTIVLDLPCPFLSIMWVALARRCCCCCCCCRRRRRRRLCTAVLWHGPGDVGWTKQQTQHGSRARAASHPPSRAAAAAAAPCCGVLLTPPPLTPHLRTLTCIEEAQAAAASLRFNATIEGMAQRIIAGMHAEGIKTFNGERRRRCPPAAVAAALPVSAGGAARPLPQAQLRACRLLSPVERGACGTVC